MQIPIMTGTRICETVIPQGTVNANICTYLSTTTVIGTIKMLSKVSDALVIWFISSSVYRRAT
jgi:hypothetical protein